MKKVVMALMVSILVLTTILIVNNKPIVKSGYDDISVIHTEMSTTTASSTTTKPSTTQKITTTKKTTTTSKATKTTTTKSATTKIKTTKATTVSTNTENLYSASYFRLMGAIYWENYRWTWYSQKVLPGPGLNIPGRHVDENGYICDANNCICLASSTLAKGTVVSTPFGKPGVIYDSGCDVGTLDVYVNF